MVSYPRIRTQLPVYFFAFLAGVGVLFHLHAVWHQQLFGDEVHSLFFFASHSWRKLLGTPIEPVHPNGYYLLLKTWYTLTPTVWALRLWQFIVFGLSTLALGAFLHKWQVRGAAWFAALALWTSSAYLWHFRFQLRMYGVGILLLLLLWNALGREKKWLAVGLSWLSLAVVYGSALGLASLWSTWLLIRAVGRTGKKTDVLFPLLAGIPVLLLALSSWDMRTTIDQGFLYWVHVPRWEDWSLAMGSFFFGLFLPYFEGYSDLSQKWRVLGLLGNGGASLLLLVGSWWGVKKRKALHHLWEKARSHDQFVVALLGITLSLYTLLFLVTVLTGGHVFHIRQLFATAVIGWMGGVWLMNRIWIRWPVLAAFLATAVIGVNLLSIVADSRPGRQTYPHHFVTLPGTPVVASVSDVELVYKQCGIFTRAAAPEACAARAITLLQSSNSPWSPPAEWSTWWMTPRAQSQLAPGSAACTWHSVDFSLCSR